MDYLYHLKTQSHTPSTSYFRHTVFGLRYCYKVMGINPQGISLPRIKYSKKLPVVLSQQEVKRLLKAPSNLKHRLILGLLYGCGLRRHELTNIKLPEVDLDRGMLHIREGKGRKDRYVPLGRHLTRGLRTYLELWQPYVWLFNGRSKQGQLSQLSGAGVLWIIQEARLEAGIKKDVTSHILRHTYATHLLEMGMDIISLKDLLGHSDIHTTLTYLHIAQLGRDKAFSPLDKLYLKKHNK